MDTTMRALQTQFDDRRFSSAVATPTCSSCCCCCCCLATSIASSTLLAQRVAKEGERHQIPNRHLLTVLAALFIPISAAIVYFGGILASMLVPTCDTGDLIGAGTAYCVNLANTPVGLLSTILWFLSCITVPFLVLVYLYTKVHVERPKKRALLVTALVTAAFIAEFFAGALLILTGVGGIVYLIMVPIVVGWITVWYRGHIGKEMNGDDKASQLTAPSGQSAQVNEMEQYVEAPKPPTEPPQQTPPASGSQ